MSGKIREDVSGEIDQWNTSSTLNYSCVFKMFCSVIREPSVFVNWHPLKLGSCPTSENGWQPLSCPWRIYFKRRVPRYLRKIFLGHKTVQKLYKKIYIHHKRIEKEFTVTHFLKWSSKSDVKDLEQEEGSLKFSQPQWNVKAVLVRIQYLLGGLKNNAPVWHCKDMLYSFLIYKFWISFLSLRYFNNHIRWRWCFL